MGFSITDVALTGFGVVQRRPAVVLAWAGLQLVVTVLATLAVGPLANALFALPRDALQDPARIQAALSPYAANADLAWLLLIPVNAVLNAAMNRAVMQPDQDRYGYLRMGLDELRQLGLILILMAMVFFAATLAGVLVTAADGSAALAATLLFGGLGLWVWLGLRLSLASALTFDTGRIDLQGAWRLSQGRAASMLAAYALSLGLCALVFILCSAVIEAAISVAALLPGGAIAQAHVPTSLAEFLRPGELVNLLLSSVAVGLIWPVWMTPPAAIYRQLRDTAASPSR